MKRIVISLLVLVAICVPIVSCGSSAPSAKTSGFAYRVFVSNPLFANGTFNAPVLNIVNAANDLLSPSTISLLTNSIQPGLMAVSPSLQYTAVYSPSGNTVTVIDNTTETIASVPGSNSPVPNINLPGYTESLVIASDNATAYAAVPTAPITGQSPGAVIAMNITTGTPMATIPVAGAHYVIPSPDGNTLLVFSDNSDAITVISTVLIGSSQNPVTAIVPGFDRPVWALFSGSTAYVFNCGPECGGKNAGISTFVVGSPGPGATIPVRAATYGMLSGSTLYVAGTPPNTACGSGTCGTLTLVDTGSMTVSGAPVLITDGFHNHMGKSDNGKLFIGARSCTNVNTSTGLTSCLTIYDTGTGKALIAATPGDVTGIQPIPGRTVTYVCQGGTFEIFDTTTDQLLAQTVPTVIVGQSYDVKLVDPPQSN